MSSQIDERPDEDLLDELGFTPSVRAKVIRYGERDDISPVLRRMVYRRDKWMCQQCGKSPYAAEPTRRNEGALHLDHIIPWSAGGLDRSDNLRTLCGPCNIAKSNFVHKNDQPAMPITRICTPCLAASSAIVARWCEQPRERFTVYCGAHNHESWAIKGWNIL